MRTNTSQWSEVFWVSDVNLNTMDALICIVIIYIIYIIESDACV